MPSSLSLHTLLVRSFQGAWEEFKEILVAHGDEVWNVRFDHGQTVLHQVIVHRPEWMPALFAWERSASMPEAWLEAVDDQGVPWLLYTLCSPVSVSAKDKAQLWTHNMRETPRFSKWLEATKKSLAPDVFFEHVQAMVHRLKVWDLPLSRAGVPFLDKGADALVRQRLNEDEAWQSAMDAIVFNPCLSPLHRQNLLCSLTRFYKDAGTRFSVAEDQDVPPSTWLCQRLLLGLLLETVMPFPVQERHLKGHDFLIKRILDQARRYVERGGVEVFDVVRARLAQLPTLGSKTFGVEIWPALSVEMERCALSAMASPITPATAADRPRL